ncbi:response regulator [Reichenbachiella carrageenanivorans]|uniref:histidine kinase n=1 Tax=Reichenbachiella carrageenanivorans TaxID=2979869 RepID=A0ABY6D1M3_9BACT|nr:two-component regulator propeller domain-containing protein [Reichenbachiella carrageenanivorans]UXX80067.1 response regulator [Reichenbachiella carrageenanivorans]
MKFRPHLPFHFTCFFYLFFSILLSASRLNAQEYFFKTLTVNNGLSQNDVSAICQDSFGFIWIGTYDGLNKFDGFTVQSYHKITTDANSLPGNRITALQEDHKKRLWIGTEGGGLAYYSLLKERFFRVALPKPLVSIHEILVTTDGSVFATTSNGVLRLVDLPNPRFEFIAVSKQLHFRSAKQDLKGNIYFAGRDGVFIYRNGLMKEISNPKNIPFTRLGFDSNNNLLAGSYNGLYQIKDGSEIIKINNPDLANGKSIYGITTDKNGNTWLGTDNYGLIQLDAEYKTISQIKATSLEERGLLSNSVLELFCDKNNNLWVGNRLGLCFASLNNVGFASLDLTRLTRPNVRSVLLDDEHLFLGINNQGLFNYNLETDTFKQILPQQINSVSSISKIDKKIYICTSNGIFQSDSEDSFAKMETVWQDHSPAPTNFTCIAKDDFSRFYLGTHAGLVVMEAGKAVRIWDKDASMSLFQNIKIFKSLYLPKKRQLLIGTISKSLFSITMDKNGNWVSAKQIPLMNINAEPIFNTSVWSIHQSADSTLWIGTDAGLFKKEKEGQKFQQVDVRGVIDKKIMCITEGTNDILWLSNTQGLISFNPKTATIRKYTYNDGLLSSTLTEGAAIDRNGRLYFGTARGVNYMDPNHIFTNPHQPQVLISKFSVHNQPVRPGEELLGSIILNENINTTRQIKLNYRQNNFTVEFTGTNYTDIQEGNFKYRLKGYDKSWIYTTSENRFISYSNLKPGNYELTLDIANKDGLWTKQPQVISMQISPAPWKTPFAYLIYILLSLAIIGAFVFFWYNRQKLNHQIELDKIIIRQDQELREVQLRFFTDIAHEFKTPLSLIIAPLNDLMNKTMSQEMRETCFQIVSRNMKRLEYLVSQFLDFGKISEGGSILQVSKHDLRKFSQETTRAFQWQIQKEQIDFRLDLKECIGYVDHDVLEKALYNVLSNAFKYTPKNGTIELKLDVDGSGDQRLAIITVSDSGPGIPDEQKSLVFDRFFHDKDRASSGIGLHLTYNLIQAHKGSISVSDSPFHGAQFTIVLPIDEETYAEKELYNGDLTERPEIIINDAISSSEMKKEGEIILIVEDDLDLRNYLMLSLQSHYVVIEANNGKEGLKMAQEELPNIIISDVMMPIMDGIEMCEHLKADSSTSHIPILLLTAKTGIEYEKKGLDAGAWDYIAKPFDSEALLQKVDNIIDTRNKFKAYLSDQNINMEVKTHYTSYDQKLMANISKIIEENLQDPAFNVNQLANEIGLSRMHLHRKLKSLVGESGKSIITRVKVKYAASMFDQGCDRVQEAMDAIGMTNYANFNNNFKRVMNMTASEYIAQLHQKPNA